MSDPSYPAGCNVHSLPGDGEELCPKCEDGYLVASYDGAECNNPDCSYEVHPEFNEDDPREER